MFEPTIGLGNILTIVAMAVTGLSIFFSLRGNVNNLSERLQMLEHELHRLTDILIQQGRQEERMTAMDARLVNQGARLDDLTIRFNKTLDKGMNN